MTDRNRKIHGSSGRTPNHHRTGLINEDYPIDPYRADAANAYDPYDRYWRTPNGELPSHWRVFKGGGPNAGDRYFLYCVVCLQPHADSRKFPDVSAGKYLVFMTGNSLGKSWVATPAFSHEKNLNNGYWGEEIKLSDINDRAVRMLIERETHAYDLDQDLSRGGRTPNGLSDVEAAIDAAAPKVAAFMESRGMWKRPPGIREITKTYHEHAKPAIESVIHAWRVYHSNFFSARAKFAIQDIEYIREVNNFLLEVFGKNKMTEYEVGQAGTTIYNLPTYLLGLLSYIDPRKEVNIPRTPNGGDRPTRAKQVSLVLQRAGLPISLEKQNGTSGPWVFLDAEMVQVGDAIDSFDIRRIDDLTFDEWIALAKNKIRQERELRMRGYSKLELLPDPDNIDATRRVDFDKLRAAHEERVRILMQGGDRTPNASRQNHAEVMLESGNAIQVRAGDIVTVDPYMTHNKNLKRSNRKVAKATKTRIHLLDGTVYVVKSLKQYTGDTTYDVPETIIVAVNGKRVVGADDDLFE